MGIFSKWGGTSPVASLRLDELNRGHETQTMRNVRNETSSLAEFLRERQLTTVDNSAAVEKGREIVEKSALLPLMFETCTAINTMAGETIVDVQSFLPPEPILCCFIYEEGGTEYVMTLELQGATPFLVFSERRWRDTMTNSFIRWLRPIAGTEPITINTKLVHALQDVGVSAQQVRKCFMYLISGMERSQTPSF
jgi:hypothetical protein